MLHLLKGSVTSHQVKADKEYKRIHEDGDWIIKGPMLVLNHPVRPVIMVRDPRSVITSKMGNTGDYFMDLYTFAARKSKSVGLMHVVLAIAHYMVNGGALIVKYEDLGANPNEVQNRVGDYWGLEYNREWSGYPWDLPEEHKWVDKLNGYRPIDAGHDWRDHRGRVNSVLSAHPELQLILELLGYEQDMDWIEGIDAPLWQQRADRSLTITV